MDARAVRRWLQEPTSFEGHSIFDTPILLDDTIDFIKNMK